MFFQNGHMSKIDLPVRTREETSCLVARKGGFVGRGVRVGSLEDVT